MEVSMKKFLAAFALLGLLTILIAACGSPDFGSSSTSSSSNSSPDTVHMGAASFSQSSITIDKGSKLTLIDDDAVVHIIANGTWDNGTAKPAQEAGAPTVNLEFNGNDTQSTHPFNTAGTYHLYCSVHTDMNLTVIVQ